MAKANYNGITPESYVIKTDNKTLSVVPRLLPHPAENEFQKIFDMKESKIRFQIQDRRGGTGKEYSVYFNFTLVDWASLYDIIDKITTDAQVNPGGLYDFSSEQYVRIYHQVEAAGPNQGLCHSIHASWKRESMKNGTPSRSPWILTVADGYAKGANGKNKGSFYEVGNSFKPAQTGMFYFTDKDLKALIKYVQKTIDANYELFASQRIPAGWDKYWALKAQGTHNGLRGDPYAAPAPAMQQAVPAAGYAYQTPYQTPPAAYAPVAQPAANYAPAAAPAYAQAIPAAQPQMAQPQPQPAAPPVVDGHQTHPYKGVIQSVNGNSFVLRFSEYQGKEGTVKFMGELPQAVHVAARSGVEKTFYLWNDAAVFYFGGIAP